MQKSKLLLLSFFLISGIANAQTTLLPDWNYRYGSVISDKLNTLLKTSDGGFLLGGFTDADSSCDVSQHTNGAYDFWIVKLNSQGIMQWEKRYGGDGSDNLTTAVQTSDGGYLLGGISASGISGDKSEPCYGFGDYWVIKIDANGIKQWDKRFGNIYDDNLTTLCKTNDGGFLLGGYSNSPMGGDITSPPFNNSADYWVVKINSSGIYQWDKRFGGDNFDWLSSVSQISDHGFLLAGFSNSDSSGNKTENSFGGYDYWVMKTDSVGNKIWDKQYGGSNDDELFATETTNNGFALAGFSYSQTSGNKTQDTYGLSDYWIVKTDANGTISWDKDFGGSNTEDDLGSIIKTQDGGYIFSAASYSPISGNKTESNLGIEQTWLVKLNSSGIKEWDKTVFTTGHDENAFIVQTNDGCFVMANQCNADSGGYKTQHNYDITMQPNTTYDYWIIKFCDSTGFHESTNSMTNDIAVNLFPNPFSDWISISINKKNIQEADFIIRNVLGKNIFQSHKIITADFYSEKLNLDFINSGIYFLEIKIDEEILTKKIVKN